MFPVVMGSVPLRCFSSMAAPLASNATINFIGVIKSYGAHNMLPKSL